MTFDGEDLLDNIEAIVKAGLPAKIAAIEAEKIAKGKGIADGLPAPEDAAYYRQTWSDKILNHSPAIFYGIEDVQTESVGPATSEKFKVFVEVVLVDNGMYADTSNRILRYSRALRECLQDKFDSVAETGRIKIETVRPVAFKMEQDSSEEIKVGGVSLMVSLA
jgi:hypothetical protein